LTRRERLAGRQGDAMGSPLRLLAPASSVDAAWRAARDAIAAVEHELSRFGPDSPLTRANRAAGSGAWQPASTLLRRSLRAAERGYRLTAGRFDPRIVGALEALGDRAGIPLPPSPQHLCPGERWLDLDPASGCIRLAAPVDLGGIGKGIALAAATRALVRQGLTPHLLEAGGDLVVAGTPPDGGLWRVAIEHPDRDLPAVIVEIERGSLATSSARRRRWIGPDGDERHHLLDPRTGRPAVGLRSLTVHAASPISAEIWSTAGFVAGSRDSDSVGRHAAWWTDEHGRIGRITRRRGTPAVTWGGLRGLNP
jgi:thiamine biosynthesis lipoprotein